MSVPNAIITKDIMFNIEPLRGNHVQNVSFSGM